MMKAKDYFKRFKEDERDLTAGEKFTGILLSVFQDTQGIVDKRGARSDGSLRAIFEEQNKKVNSFVRMVNKDKGVNLRRNIYKTFIKEEMPILAESLNW